MPDASQIPHELVVKLANATARYHAAANAHELAARMYTASQAELGAAERDLRELGRACEMLRALGTTSPADMEAKISAAVRAALGVNGKPAAPTTTTTPVKLSPEAEELAQHGGDEARAALEHMIKNPGQPVPGIGG